MYIRMTDVGVLQSKPYSEDSAHAISMFVVSVGEAADLNARVKHRHCTMW